MSMVDARELPAALAEGPGPHAPGPSLCSAQALSGLLAGLPRGLFAHPVRSGDVTADGGRQLLQAGHLVRAVESMDGKRRGTDNRLRDGPVPGGGAGTLVVQAQAG